MDKKLRFNLTRLARNLTRVNYEKEAMDELFLNWMENPVEKREYFLNFWKSINYRLYLEILAYYTSSSKIHAITFTV